VRHESDRLSRLLALGANSGDGLERAAMVLAWTKLAQRLAVQW
jgi:hypothetical protein